MGKLFLSLFGILPCMIVAVMAICYCNDVGEMVFILSWCLLWGIFSWRVLRDEFRAM